MLVSASDGGLLLEIVMFDTSYVAEAFIDNVNTDMPETILFDIMTALSVLCDVAPVPFLI
jgi:hypothetical protein